MPVRLRNTATTFAPMRTVGVFVFVVVGLLCVAGCWTTEDAAGPVQERGLYRHPRQRREVRERERRGTRHRDPAAVPQALDKAGKQGKGALAVVKVDVGLGLTGGEAMALVVDSADAGCLDQLPRSFASHDRAVTPIGAGQPGSGTHLPAGDTGGPPDRTRVLKATRPKVARPASRASTHTATSTGRLGPMLSREGPASQGPESEPVLGPGQVCDLGLPARGQ